MRVKLWGVRGSIPSPIQPSVLEAKKKGLLRGFLQAGHAREDEIDGYLRSTTPRFLSGHGGNTLCVEVRAETENPVIIDAGSGIREAGNALMKGPCGKGKGVVHLFFTHFHWDHLLGLPFFTPIYIPGNEIHVYHVQDVAEQALRTLFQKPFFPVPYESLGAKFIYHPVNPRESVEVEGLVATPYMLDHPDPCWGWKMEKDGKTYSHCVDTEAKRYTDEALADDLPLYENVDLLLWDAQYSLSESISKMDWGHSTANLGLDIALRRGIRRILFAHHDPAADETRLFGAEKATRAYHRAKVESMRKAGKDVPDVAWAFAVEGMELEV